MNEQLAITQSMRYAEELRDLYAREHAQRDRAEWALAELVESYRVTVRALAAALELRDDETGGHAERVTELGLRLATVAAPELAADPHLEFAFLLHDVGKIGIPDAILLKPGPLDASEFEVMKYHTELGERLLTAIPHLEGLPRQVAAAHHERWDGTGYPRGLSGTDIPLAARIFSIVDAFDAMTNDRPYRRALSVGAALDEIRAGAGTQFDRRLSEAFVALVEG